MQDVTLYPRLDPAPQAEVFKKIVAHARKRARSGINRRMWAEERERKRDVG